MNKIFSRSNEPGSKPCRLGERPATQGLKNWGQAKLPAGSPFDASGKHPVDWIYARHRVTRRSMKAVAVIRKGKSARQAQTASSRFGG
jgi:hypothetical protein